MQTGCSEGCTATIIAEYVALKMHSCRTASLLQVTLVPFSATSRECVVGQCAESICTSGGLELRQLHVRSLCTSGAVAAAPSRSTRLWPRQKIPVLVEVRSPNVGSKRSVRRLKHGLGCLVEAFVPAGRPAMRVLAPMQVERVLFDGVPRWMK